MSWVREEVTHENTYIDSVIGLWKVAYQSDDANMTIVMFCDEPRTYYLRTKQTEACYDRSTCLPIKFKTARDAIAYADMLVATDVDSASLIGE